LSRSSVRKGLPAILQAIFPPEVNENDNQAKNAHQEKIAAAANANTTSRAIGMMASRKKVPTYAGRVKLGAQQRRQLHILHVHR